VLDLEAIARHKGSMLGGDPHHPQPSQTAFESLLWQALLPLNPEQPVWVESESRRIGECHLPESLINAIRSGACWLVDAPMPVRVAIILSDYAERLQDPAWIASKIEQFTAWQSHERLQQWRNWIAHHDWPALAESLMEHHYDPVYQQSLTKHFNVQGARRINLSSMAVIESTATSMINTLSLSS
jgi:tRNA 2-selenouridine synthase